MSAEKEICDIYDVNKIPTGKTVDRTAISLSDEEYFLIVSAVLVNEDKKILIVSGCSYPEFTLDKSIEKVWDFEVKEILKKLEIEYSLEE